jgi:hypothetical protein
VFLYDRFMESELALHEAVGAMAPFVFAHVARHMHAHAMARLHSLASDMNGMGSAHRCFMVAVCMCLRVCV